MNIRNLLGWLGLSAMAFTMGAGPAGSPAHAAPAAVHAPATRLQPRIGAAPKPEFHVGGHTYKIESSQPGVTAVRSMPPKNYDVVYRTRTVESFYDEKFAKERPSREQLAVLYCGPFRREFIWWAWHAWAPHDRALWAWHNHAYFDKELWDQWMLDREFAQQVAEFEAQHVAQKPGYIPPEYATNSPEVIYNDEYIDAVYNPDPTPPSIIVDSTAGGRLSNLMEGAPRLFGHRSLVINSLGERVKRFQFVSLPADFDPTYQIEVKRDGDLYAFGPNTTPPNEAFGADAANWVPVQNIVAGSGIDVVYQRQVKTGDKIRVHGLEWSITSEQIELFAAASTDALAASHHVVRDLDQMVSSKGGFIQSVQGLADYVQETRDAANKMITPNGNIDDDAVADCHYELTHLEKIAEQSLAQNSGSAASDTGGAFIARIKALQGSLNEVDGLRDPSLPPEPALTTESQPARPEVNPTVANGAVPAGPHGIQNVVVKYASGSPEFGTLKNGVKPYKDRKYSLVNLPKEMSGLMFAKKSIADNTDVDVDCPAGTLIYAVVDMGGDPRITWSFTKFAPPNHSIWLFAESQTHRSQAYTAAVLLWRL
jgi:hypothetical protein